MLGYVTLFLVVVGFGIFIGYTITFIGTDFDRKYGANREKYNGSLNSPSSGPSTVASGSSTVFQFGSGTADVTATIAQDPNKFVQGITACRKEATTKYFSGFKIAMESVVDGTKTTEEVGYVAGSCADTFAVPAG